MAEISPDLMRAFPAYARKLAELKEAEVRFAGLLAAYECTDDEQDPDALGKVRGAVKDAIYGALRY